MAAAVTVSILIGCGGDPDRSESGSREGAQNPVPADSVYLDETLRLGSVHGGPAAFGRIAALEADPEGNLYIADGLSNRVNVFTSDGDPLWNLGGKGSGPGEFQMISGLAIDPSGNLWVMDPSASRFTVFGRDGELRATVPRPFSRATTIPWLGRIDQRGFLYDITASPQGAGPETRVIVRYRVSGEELIGVDSVRLPSYQPQTYERVSGNLRMLGTLPWASAQRWQVNPDGTVWLGLTGDYTLHRIAASGDTLATLRHSLGSVSVTAHERDSVATTLGVDVDRIPRVKPAFRSLIVADDGNLWVEPWTEEGRAWDVFDSSGRFLGRVRSLVALETEDPVPIVRGSYLYAVTRDELDIPYVVRLRIPGF